MEAEKGILTLKLQPNFCVKPFRTGTHVDIAHPLPVWVLDRGLADSAPDDGASPRDVDGDGDGEFVHFKTEGLGLIPALSSPILNLPTRNSKH